MIRVDVNGFSLRYDINQAMISLTLQKIRSGLPKNDRPAIPFATGFTFPDVFRLRFL